ncbi:MAG: NAD(P)-dependent oxidoreductase [Flavobacterium sp.]|nr:MAG: NAD(P)-dependent oxidoreductase [Flavobacterium sp.]
MNNENIGFVGLGNMGHPMAKNLEKAGFKLYVYNRTASSTKGFENTTTVCTSVSDLVEKADVVFTMLTNDAAVEAVYDEILNNSIAGKLFIDMSTISQGVSIATSNRLTQKNASFIDAPVAGSTKPATDGTLIIMVGGAEKDLDRATPYLSKLGKKIKYLGEQGNGLAAKISINYFLSIIYGGLAETVLLSDKLGLSRNDMLEIINESACGNGATAVKTPMLLNNSYQPAFGLNLMLKDIKLADDTAATLPIGKTVLNVFDQASKDGFGEKDVMAVIEYLEGIKNNN